MSSVLKKVLFNLFQGAIFSILLPGSALADEVPLGGDVFRTGAVGRDIFSPAPTARQARQPEQSAAKSGQPPLLGEGALSPALQERVKDSGINDILEQSRRLQRLMKESSAGRINPPNPANRSRTARERRNPTVAADFSRAGFWPKNNPFLPPSRLSLIVDGSDIEHVQNSLRRLAKLARQRNVKIGNVYLVGMKAFGELLEQNAALSVRHAQAAGKFIDGSGVMIAATLMRNALYQHIEDAGLGHYEVLPTDRVLERWNLQYSPTWVVRHKGRDYVFEGFENPESFFNREGQFIREDR